MSVSLLAVSGYRSLQNLVLPLAPLTLISGANGSGKSNLYRALRLMVAAARRDLEGELAREGGLPAVFWAGPEQISGAMRRGEQNRSRAARGVIRCACGWVSPPIRCRMQSRWAIPPSIAVPSPSIPR